MTPSHGLLLGVKDKGGSATACRRYPYPWRPKYVAALQLRLGV
ncbi:MAG: hypothetical protein WCR27_04995 [Eubacteriales bacterium]